MDISSVKTAGESGVIADQKGSKTQNIGQKGQIVQGLITKVSDKISITFNDKEVEVSKSAVRDAKEGEIRNFEIMDVTEHGIVLKEVGSAENSVKSNGVVCTNVEIDKTVFLEFQQKVSEEFVDMAKGAEDTLEKITNRMTSGDYEKLNQEGLSLEEYQLERLDRALERIKVQRSTKERSLENQVETNKEYKEYIQKAAINNKSVSGREASIAKRLIEVGLPVTQENVEKIENAMKMAEATGAMSDRSMNYLIDNNLDFTIENIYKGFYAGSSQKHSDYKAICQSYQTSGVSYNFLDKGRVYGMVPVTNGESAWEAVKSQAEKIINEAGFSKEPGRLEEAKWLFTNDLPITAENLKKLEQLQTIKNQYNSDDLLKEVVGTYANGEPPERTSLMSMIKSSSKTVEAFLAQLSQLEQSMTGTLDVSQITKRRQVEEIRLKMTIEAGQKLLGKGIVLDVKGLEQVVDGLKEIEDDYYRNLLREGNVPDSHQNKELLRSTLEKLNELKQSPSYVLGVTMKGWKVRTVEGLHGEAVSMKAAMDRAGERYDALRTQPSDELGDSIEKAFQNIDNLLQDIGMEQTDANRRAVKILGYNSMDITEESILQIKAYDKQVNSILEHLHPAIAVEMIKAGKNPLNLPVMDLNKEIVKIKDDIGVTKEEKYSKFLWKLEKEDTLTKEERNAFIGIYRLLNNVEKSNGAAIGSVLHAGQEVTLGNLLTAVRTNSNGGVDIKVDDSIGTLENLAYQRDNVTEQIEDGFIKSTKEEYTSQLVTEIQDKISPEGLIQAIGTTEESFLSHLADFMGQSIEHVSELLNYEDKEAEQAYNEEQLDQWKNAESDNKSSVALLTENEQPVTMHNLMAANILSDGGKNFYKEILYRSQSLKASEKLKIKSAVREISDNITDKDSMEDGYNKLEESIQAILNKEYGSHTITSNDIAALKLLGNTMELTKSLSNKEYYEIPLMIGDSITSINLTIVSGAKETGKVHICVDSEKLGLIEAEMTIKKSQVKGYVLCDDREGYLAMSGEKNYFKSVLRDLGLSVTQIDYGMDKRQNGSYIRKASADETTDTSLLYQTAKAFVQNIKIVETRILNS